MRAMLRAKRLTTVISRSLSSTRIEGASRGAQVLQKAAQAAQGEGRRHAFKWTVAELATPANKSLMRDYSRFAAIGLAMGYATGVEPLVVPPSFRVPAEERQAFIERLEMRARGA